MYTAKGFLEFSSFLYILRPLTNEGLPTYNSHPSGSLLGQNWYQTNDFEFFRNNKHFCVRADQDSGGETTDHCFKTMIYSSYCSFHLGAKHFREGRPPLAENQTIHTVRFSTDLMRDSTFLNQTLFQKSDRDLLIEQTWHDQFGEILHRNQNFSKSPNLSYQTYEKLIHWGQEKSHHNRKQIVKEQTENLASMKKESW